MATQNGRFLKVDGAFQRPIDWNALNISSPAYTGLGGSLQTSQNTRTLAPATTVPSGGGSPLPTSQGAPAQPTMNQQPTGPSQYDNFNTLMMDLLKSAQGLGTADLLKRKRELERESASRTAAPTEESLRTLSPSQQSAIRSGSVSALSPEIDDNAYQLKKAEQTIDNFFRTFGEATKLSKDMGDKMVAPESVIKNAQLIIQSDSSKMATVLAGFNDKSKETILGGLDYSKMKDPSRELDDEYKRAQIRKLNAPTPSGAPGQLSALAQAVQNGTIALDKIPIAQRSAVAMELATSGLPSTRQQSLSANLDVVNSLINNENRHKISGFIQGKLRLGDMSPSAQLALNQFDQLKGTLSLENREKLKGSGAISDFEFKVLSQAATALGRNLDDASFDEQLKKIRDIFEGKYAGTNAGGTNPPPSFTLPDGSTVHLQPDGTYK